MDISENCQEVYEPISPTPTPAYYETVIDSNATIRLNNDQLSPVDKEKNITDKIDELLQELDNRESRKRDLPVKSYRVVIPLLLAYCFDHPNHSKKLKGLWKKKPECWPEDCPFEDPNNSQNSKIKPKKEILHKMFAYLKSKYLQVKSENKETQQVSMNDSLQPPVVFEDMQTDEICNEISQSSIINDSDSNKEIKGENESNDINCMLWNYLNRIKYKLSVLKVILGPTLWKLLSKVYELLEVCQEYQSNEVRAVSGELEICLDLVKQYPSVVTKIVDENKWRSILSEGVSRNNKSLNNNENLRNVTNNQEATNFQYKYQSAQPYIIDSQPIYLMRIPTTVTNYEDDN